MDHGSPAEPMIWPIEKGWDVFGADNRWIGRVARVDGDSIQVTAPRPFWRRKTLHVDFAVVDVIDEERQSLHLAGLTRALAGLDSE